MSTRNVNVLAIPIALLLLGVFQAVGLSNDARSSVDLSEQIEAAFNSVPERLESESAVWLQNRIVPVPSNQGEILRLTSSVSREYLRLGTFPPITATLFIAFCDDARSMLGHHPPVCYPASGWRLQSEETEVRRLLHSDLYEIKYSIYSFSKHDLKLSVVSGFMSSPGLFRANMEEIEGDIQPSLLGGRGLCQFQVLFQGTISDSDLHQYATEILRGIPATIFDAVTSDSGSLDGKKRSNGVES